MKGTTALAAALLLLSAGLLHASESSTPLALGGLVVSGAAGVAIQFDSADIQIDPANVSAKYRFTNTGLTPAPVTLSFPVPDLDFSDPDSSYAIPGSDPLNFVGLSVRIDGKANTFAFTQSAVLDGRDITGLLRGAKLALVPVGTFQNGIAALSPEQRQKLVDARIIVENGADQQGNAIYSPNWVVRTNATRRVSLNPGQAMAVDLKYRTSVGYSLDTPLRLPLRTDRNLAALVQLHRTDYCIDDGFYTGLDKIVAQPAAPPPVQPAPLFPGAQPVPAPAPQAVEGNLSRLRERSFIFAMQGRVAQGPYKDFRLVVDKGRANRVVSFCLNNLKRISPTAFEMRAVDFQPAGDLKVLLIGRD